MSVNALSKELYVPAQRLNEIVRERRGVTADTADQINKLITPRKTGHEAA